MPVYTYRREDGSTFDYRQSFSDDALTVDPVTGQRVIRVVHAAGVIFKGSGFYVNDSKGGSKSSTATAVNNNASGETASSETGKTSEKSDTAAAAPATTPTTTTATSDTAAR
jgi:predicted nucleic acid-binding Zn ribbon protein